MSTYQSTSTQSIIWFCCWQLLSSTSMAIFTKLANTQSCTIFPFTQQQISQSWTALLQNFKFWSVRSYSYRGKKKELIDHHRKLLHWKVIFIKDKNTALHNEKVGAADHSGLKTNTLRARSRIPTSPRVCPAGKHRRAPVGRPRLWNRGQTVAGGSDLAGRPSVSPCPSASSSQRRWPELQPNSIRGVQLHQWYTRRERGREYRRRFRRSTARGSSNRDPFLSPFFVVGKISCPGEVRTQIWPAFSVSSSPRRKLSVISCEWLTRGAQDAWRVI